MRGAAAKSGVLALALAGAVLSGCSGANGQFPSDALLRVPSGQFHRGAPPSDVSGPALGQFGARTPVFPGEINTLVSGLAAPEATAVIVYIEGDVGYWVITPTTVEPTQNNQLNFSAPIQFSPTLPQGKFKMIGRAVDIHGHVGPPSESLITVASDGTALPMATTLLVSLRWDTEADLDLHLVIPSGVEIYSAKINSVPRPDLTTPDDAYKAGGILDFDSNASCVIEGRRNENIYWTQTPPSGHYIARVETYSMCSEFQADWTLAITRGDDTLGIVHGVSRDSDTLAKRGRGAGLTALEFDIP